MVIDTSAIIAVLLNEPNAVRIARAIETGSPRLLSAANFLETSLVIESRKGEAGGRELDLLIYRAAIEIVAVDQDHAEIARICLRSRNDPAVTVAIPRRGFLAD
jgi:ribonuclease VapC